VCLLVLDSRPNLSYRCAQNRLDGDADRSRLDRDLRLAVLSARRELVLLQEAVWHAHRLMHHFTMSSSPEAIPSTWIATGSAGGWSGGSGDGASEGGLMQGIKASRGCGGVA
jgi:hypothetical protein